MLIDSNILIYSISRRSPKHKSAQKFIQENTGGLEIAHQNIFETLRVLTHNKFPLPMKIEDAIKAVGKITDACNVISPTYHTFEIAIALIKKHKLARDQVFDAYLAATALDNGIDTIATDNVKDFDKLVEVKIINPFK